MIKQIQLRGISRTPSDRLSEDGGLSESLNMYMDTAENAPAFIPNDTTGDLGLPTNLQAERIFIHKTANYENFIVVLRDKIIAYTPNVEDEEPIDVLTISSSEVIDIAAIGNTLVVSTKSNLYYILYRDRQYSFLGNKIPFPQISFTTTNESYDSVISRFDPYLSDDLEKEWNTNLNAQQEHKNTKVTEILKDWWEEYDSFYSDESNKDLFSSPIFIRYAVETYDGSLISSMPILINASDADIIANAVYYESESVDQDGKPEIITVDSLTARVSLFKILAKFHNDTTELQQWRDVYSSINIYLARPYKDFTNRNASSISDIKWEKVNDLVNFSAKVRMTIKTEDALVNGCATSFLAKKIPIFDKAGNATNEFRELLNGLEFGPSIIPEGGYEAQERLESDDMKHYLQTSERLDTYNNQMLLVQPSQIIDYDYNWLNSFVEAKRDPNLHGTNIIWEVTWYIKTSTKDKLVRKRFHYYSDDKIYPFQIFPDSRAYKVVVKYGVSFNELNTGYFDMYPHPYLDCAYCFFPFDKTLENYCQMDTPEEYPSDEQIDSIDDLDNKLIISKSDNPFFFPVENRYTFQSKVIGVAVASTALSQGQFGQFPLYVFTEDGIWAMETASDGSFLSSKPLSRIVCVNPDSITSIDNAVVFVSNNGVMLIQGSEVVNLSPYMNGRHYLPNDSATALIGKQSSYVNLLGTIGDQGSFISYVKDAKVAYDHVGQRLIFISPSQTEYQYIYKIDTQTWHKLHIGKTVTTPLNSYPNCYIQGKTTDGYTRIYDFNSILSPDSNQDTAKGILITRPFDLGMPDVFKSITSIKVRGDYDKGNVKYFLQGSDNGRDFYNLNSLRGKSWKMFRIFILADLEPTERISWIDVDFEPRYNNRLR